MDILRMSLDERSANDRQSAAFLMAIVLQGMAAKAIYAATELGIIDSLAERAHSSGELAKSLGVEADALHRMLLTLSSLGVISQEQGDLFALADLGRPLREDSAVSVRELVRLMAGSEVSRGWDELAASVRTGQPGWVLAHGMSWTDFYGQNQAAATVFNRAMAETSKGSAAGIVKAADLSRFNVVVDLGGGDGTLMAYALKRYPAMSGLLFDMGADANEEARKNLASNGIAERCEIIQGNFFHSVPRRADAYILKQVLHDWDDEQATIILRNIKDASAAGHVLVVDRVLPDRVKSQAKRADTGSLLLDLHMLVVTGGKERTESEFRDLLSAAGYAVASISEPIDGFDYRVIDATVAD
jgi:predicted O-methyltransferase YrrM